MGNEWRVTEGEYHEAFLRSRDGEMAPAEAAAYYELCRHYRGETYDADDAARGLLLLRLATNRNGRHVHQWKPTRLKQIARCAVCGLEKA